MNLIFEWDKIKATANLRKHKISFDEAKTVFDDLLAISFSDEFHSDEENRFISIGVSNNNRILLVVHTEQDESENTIVIRIISCRKVTAQEREIYEKGE